MKTCAILPAYNEADSIAKVISDIKKLNIDVVVCDDGSDDETSLIAEREGAYVIRHQTRRGKGASLKDGFYNAIAKGYDNMITLDADGQHEPSYIPKFIEKARETGASVVVGNRMDNPAGMPRIRIFTNWLMSLIISAICRQRVPDTQCGYRLFKSQAINSIKIRARKFEIDSELLIKLARKGYRIISIPVSSIYGGETSQIKPLSDTFRFLRFLTKILLKD